MDTAKILAELEDQRNRIDQAISALNGGYRRRGRPSTRTSTNGRRRRHMSPAVKKRLSLLAKQRWAARKKEGKNRL